MANVYHVALLCLCAFGVQAEVVQEVRAIDVSDEATLDTFDSFGPDTRILEGTQVKTEDFPFQVSLRVTTTQGQLLGCGGTIIDPLWVLTAAHCLHNNVFAVLRFGATNITRPELVIESGSGWWLLHPNYNPVNFNNDIAVIRLTRPLEFSDRIQPIRLQSNNEAATSFATRLLTASGYGLTADSSEGGTGSEVLYAVDLVGITVQLCSMFYNTAAGGPVIISSLCTVGSTDIRQGPCQGDSGGPLIERNDNGVPTQVGIASFVSGSGCHVNHPAGFVQPGFFHGWLTQVTGRNFNVASSFASLETK